MPRIQARAAPRADQVILAASGRQGRNMLGVGTSPPLIIAIPSTSIVPHQTIVVLDFGSQYTQLIARRLRELSVYSEVWPPDTPADKIRARGPVGVILSGGPKSVGDPGAPK